MNSSIQDKLSSFAPEPPKGLWEAIEDALDGQVSPLLTQKLSDLQVAPPSRTWEKIEAQLEIVKETPVIPLFRKRTFLRVAAAAAFVLLAGSAVFFVNQKASIPASITQTSRPAIVSPVIIKKPAPAPAAQKPGPIENTQVKIASLSKPQEEAETPKVTRSRKTVTHNDPVPLEALALSHQYIPVSFKPLRTEPLARPEVKYMVYTDGDGRTMKLSRKLYDFMDCVTRDFDCQQRLRQWQQAMTKATLSTDFTGVLEIIRNLGENQ